MKKQLMITLFVFCASLLQGYVPSVPSHPSLIRAADGSTLAFWLVTEGSQTSIKSALYLSQMGWLTPAFIPTEDRNVVSLPQVAINSLGNIVAVWESYSLSLHTHLIEAAFSSTESGEWSLPQTIANLEDKLCQNIKVSLGDDGHATLLWCSELPENPGKIQVNFSVADYKGSWSEPLSLSDM